MRRLIVALLLSLAFALAWGLISGGGYVLGLALGLGYVAPLYMLVFFMRPYVSWKLLMVCFGLYTLIAFGAAAMYEYDPFALIASVVVAYLGCVVSPVAFRMFLRKQPLPSVGLTALTTFFPIAGIFILTYV